MSACYSHKLHIHRVCNAPLEAGCECSPAWRMRAESTLTLHDVVQVKGYVLSALAKVHAQARLPLGEGFEQLLHDAASSHNADLQLRAVQIQAMFE